MIDECFGGDPDHAFGICDGLRKLPGLDWVTFGRVDLLTPELLKAMAKAGCSGLIIGFESGDQEMLRRLGKGYQKVDRYADVVEWCRNLDISISAQTLHKPPYETEDHEAATAKMLRVLKLRDQSLGYVLVMPGMPLYDRCVQAGLLDDSFWERPEPYFVYEGGLTWKE